MRRVVLTFLFTGALFAQKQPFTVDTMLKLARIGEPVLSPDGTQVAFTVQKVDVDKNTKPTQIYLVPVQGGAPRQLTHEESNEGTSNERPRWSPDSKQIFFVSNRGGSSQIWVMNADGSGAHQITKFAADSHKAYASTVAVDTLLGLSLNPAGLDWTPKAGSPAESGAVTVPAGKVTNFFGGTFTNTTYLGAAQPGGAKWWQGWTAYSIN